MRVSKRFGAAAVLSLLAGGAMAADSDISDRTEGAQTYATVCAACHQPTGEGVADSFPPLTAHPAAILSRPGGRDYLIRLVLYGVAGQITVEGKLFDNAMPPWNEVLTDAQVAAALDYVLHSWANEKALPADFRPIQPAEVAAARATQLTSAEVYALRGQIMPAAPPALVEAATPPAFTEEQANRGHQAYRRACQDCHGANLNDGEFGGAPLTGLYFSRHWGVGNVAALYGFLSTKMPPDRPGKLNPQTYADLTAFILTKNGYQPGQTELPPEPGAQQRMSLKR
jgi:mono/diheme cytochrome c family protein